jgi:nitrite reductase/ring-hydroxylating ferredoxin subunit
MLAGIGTIAALFLPIVFAAGPVLDPWLRRRRGSSTNNGGVADRSFVRIAPLDALAADGVPRFFPVIANKMDAWTTLPQQRVGAIFLVRKDDQGEPRVAAFSAACPHLGCIVDFNAQQQQFACPCHAAAFGLDGARVSGPSKRGLDALDVELRKSEDGTAEVYVAYQRFRPGLDVRVPLG